MKLVKENLNEFKQGGDPYNKLGVGKYDDNYDFENPQEGDEIELIEELTDIEGWNNDMIPSKQLHRYNEGLIFTWRVSYWYTEKYRFTLKNVYNIRDSFKKLR
jgi:hypothetical protein